MSNELGKRIRRERERKHMTQQQLGEAVGVKLRTVGNWERGETVPMNRLASLEEVLGVNLTAEPTLQRASIGDLDVEVMFLHYGTLTPMERMRLARLIQDQAMRDLEGGEPNG